MKQLSIAVAFLIITVSGGFYLSEGCGKDGMKKSSSDGEGKGSYSNIKIDPSMAKDAKVEAYKAKYPNISHEEFIAAINSKGVIIIDANKPETYDKHRVPGAYTIHDTKALRAALPANKNALIVAYCGGPKCTAWFKAADYIAGEGYQNIKHYSSGIKGWIEKKEKTQSTSEI